MDFCAFLKNELLTYSADLDLTILHKYDRRLELTTTLIQHQNSCASLEILASSSVTIQLNDSFVRANAEKFPDFLKNSFFSNDETDVPLISCIKNTFRDFNSTKGFPNDKNQILFVPCNYKLQFKWHIVPNAKWSTSYSRKDLERFYSVEVFPNA